MMDTIKKFYDAFHQLSDLHHDIIDPSEVSRIVAKHDSNIDITSLLHDPITSQSTSFFKHIHYSICSSTQDAAKNYLMQDDQPALITSDYQFEGYGRNGPWHSSYGQHICASIIIPKKITDMPITVIVSYLLQQYIKELTIYPCKIKWPNDILINGLKVAGILAESSACNSFWIIGIGINHHSDTTLITSSENDIGPTCLNDWTTHQVSRNKVLANILTSVCNHTKGNLSHLAINIQTDWAQHDYFYKRTIRSKDQLNLKGTGAGINKSGQYLVLGQDNKHYPIVIGGIQIENEDIVTH